MLFENKIAYRYVFFIFCKYVFSEIITSAVKFSPCSFTEMLLPCNGKTVDNIYIFVSDVVHEGASNKDNYRMLLLVYNRFNPTARRFSAANVICCNGELNCTELLKPGSIGG